MPRFPDIQGPDRLKPLCYDPATQRYLTIDDLESEAQGIVPLSVLTRAQRKSLVIERQRRGPDYRVASLSGTRTRDDVVREIEAETEFGRESLEAEMAYLEELLAQLQEAIGP